MVAPTDAPTNEQPNLLTSKTVAEKGVYSRGLMLKVLEVQTEVPRHTPTDSTGATESGRSSPEVQEEEEGDEGAKQAKLNVKARAASMDCSGDKAELGLQLRPRAMSEGTAGEAVSAAAASGQPTTVMLRNIPNQYSREKLCKRLDSQGFEGVYDFLYLPIDRNSERNMGYAFINFRSQNACTEFARCFSGKLASECLPGYKSNKVCEVRVAEVQGQQANLEKMTSPNFFQHLADHEEWQPVFFDEKGERMPLAARDHLEAQDGHGKRNRAGSRTTPTPSPKLLPFMPPIMVPYAFPGMPMEDLPPARKQSGVELCAEAPEFVPSTSSSCMSSAITGAVDTATAMAVKHLEAEAAARAAAVAQARATAGRPKDMKKQIEYYFSSQNISHDVYLRKMMDESGWVKLKDIVKFPKLRALNADIAGCNTALSGSPTVELTEDGMRVRIKDEELRAKYPQVTEDTKGTDKEAAVGSSGEQEAAADA